MSRIITNRGRAIDDPAGQASRFGENESWANLSNGCGVTWKAQSLPCLSIAGNGTLSDGFLYFTPIAIPSACTVTGAVYYQGTQGNFTANNNNYIFLYKLVRTGIWRRVASSANNTSLWKAASNTYASESFSSPYVAEVGMYAIGYTYQASAATTAPTLGSAVPASVTPGSRIIGLANLGGLHTVTTRSAGPADAGVNTVTMLPETMSPDNINNLGGNTTIHFWALY